MTADSLESILRGQVGIVLGILLTAILFGYFVKYTLTKFLDAVMASNQDVTEQMKIMVRATNRLTTVVGTSLISSEIAALRNVGKQAVDDVHMEESKT